MSYFEIIIIAILCALTGYARGCAVGFERGFNTARDIYKPKEEA